MKDQNKPILYLLLALGGVLALIGITWGNAWLADRVQWQDDFLTRWTAARAWVIDGVSPYDPSVNQAARQALDQRSGAVSAGKGQEYFAYPLVSTVFFAPFALFEYGTARALWMTVLELSSLALATVALRIADWTTAAWKTAFILVFSLLWYYAVRMILVGQFAGIDALLIALALLFIQQKVDFLAGVLLALATAKPQMVFLILLLALIWAISVGRRDLFWGIVLSLVIYYGASLILLPNWPLQYLRQLLEYTRQAPPRSLLTIIANSMPGISRQLSIFLHTITIGYMLIEWTLSLGKGERWFIWTASMTLVITNWVTLPTASSNYVLLLPVFFLILKTWEDRWIQFGRWGVWLSFLFIGLGVWGLFFATSTGGLESAWMYLPLPLFCLIGLWWVRWWFIRPPRAYIEELVKKVD